MWFATRKIKPLFVCFILIERGVTNPPQQFHILTTFHYAIVPVSISRKTFCHAFMMCFLYLMHFPTSISETLDDSWFNFRTPEHDTPSLHCISSYFVRVASFSEAHLFVFCKINILLTLWCFSFQQWHWRPFAFHYQFFSTTSPLYIKRCVLASLCSTISKKNILAPPLYTTR